MEGMRCARMAVHGAEPDLAAHLASLGEGDALPRGCGVDREDAQQDPPSGTAAEAEPR